MRFLLSLQCSQRGEVLPINYQYPLSAAIYKILDQADAKYAAFLHESGYGKGFKLFTFSDIRCPFRIEGDRLVLLQRETQVIVCFHVPVAASAFIQGLFLSKQIEIADKKSKAVFTISQVASLVSPLAQFDDNQIAEMLLRPISPVVCGLKDEKGNYTFLSPEHEQYTKMLFLNWEAKYKTVLGEGEAGSLLKNGFMEVWFYKDPPRSRLIQIKAGTTAETKIRGFVNFQLKVKGSPEALDLLLNSGVGLYNAQGMGCVEVIS